MSRVHVPSLLQLIGLLVLVVAVWVMAGWHWGLLAAGGALLGVGLLLERPLPGGRRAR